MVMIAAQDAQTVIDEVLTAVASGRHQAVVVDSPPGAGKSSLVVRAAAHLAQSGEPLMVVAQTNGQVDDLVDRLAGTAPGLPIARLSAQSYQPTAQVTRHPNVTVTTRATDLADHKVIIGTAAKWATIAEGAWPWAIIDEAYQMRSDMLLRIANRLHRALFVGDPGQLDPFSTVDVDRWVGLTWDPMQSAVAVLLRNNPDIPVYRLPVSWRLPHSAAPVVAEAFYPFTGFTAGTTPADRGLTLTTRPLRPTPVDEAVQTAAANGWAFYELPARHTVRTDTEATTACAEIAVQFLRRGTTVHCERNPDGVPLSAGRIAIGTAHRDQATAIRALLSGEYAAITVDTANRLQGREYDITIMLHPLSGRRDATAFHLESGRLCVLASRHRHTCVVVARAGIPELLDAHPSTEPVHLNVPAKFPDGWEANQAVMAHLHQYRITTR
jgi:hypothetical protein